MTGSRLLAHLFDVKIPYAALRGPGVDGPLCKETGLILFPMDNPLLNPWAVPESVIQRLGDTSDAWCKGRNVRW